MANDSYFFGGESPSKAVKKKVDSESISKPSPNSNSYFFGEDKKQASSAPKVASTLNTPQPQLPPETQTGPQTLTPGLNKLASMAAGGEMGALAANMPGVLGKLIEPTAQAAIAGYEKAKTFPEGHKLEHWGEIARAAAHGVGNPNYTLTNLALKKGLNSQINPEITAPDMAATMGGALLGANLRNPSPLISAVKQIPAALGGAALFGGAGLAGDLAADALIKDPQLKEGAKAASEGLLPIGMGHLASKMATGAGDGFNKVGDMLNKIPSLFPKAPSSQQVAQAEELNNVLNNAPGKELLKPEANINAAPPKSTPEELDTKFNELLGPKEAYPTEASNQIKHLLDTQKLAVGENPKENSTEGIIGTSRAIVDKGYNRQREAFGNDLIPVDQNKLNDIMRMDEIKLYKENPSAQKTAQADIDNDIEQAQQRGDLHTVANLQSLKKAVDMVINGPVYETLSKGHTNYDASQQLIRQINAVKSGINLNNMTSDWQTKLNTLKPLIKDSMLQHAQAQEASGNERYKGVADMMPVLDRAHGEIQKFKNTNPILDTSRAQNLGEQRSDTNTQRSLEDQLMKGNAPAGLEHITRATEDLQPFMPEISPQVANNKEATQKFFDRSLGTAASYGKENDFLKNYLLSKETEGHTQTQATPFIQEPGVLGAGRIPSDQNFLKKGKFETSDLVKNLTSDNPDKAVNFLKNVTNDKEYPGAKSNIEPLIKEGLSNHIASMFRQGSEKNTENVSDMEKVINKMSTLHSNLEKHGMTDVLHPEDSATISKAAKIKSLMDTAQNSPYFRDRLTTELNSVGDKGPNAATRMGKMIDNMSQIAGNIQSRQAKLKQSTQPSSQSIWSHLLPLGTAKKIMHWVKAKGGVDTTATRQGQLDLIQDRMQHPEGREWLAGQLKAADGVLKAQHGINQSQLINAIGGGYALDNLLHYAKPQAMPATHQLSPDQIDEMKRKQQQQDQDFMRYQKAFD